MIQEYSVLDLLREGMLRWCRRKFTRRLIKYLNITSSAWRGKLKGFGNIWWDKVNRIYTPEGEGGSVYPGTGDGIREDTYMLAGRYLICRAIQ